MLFTKTSMIAFWSFLLWSTIIHAKTTEYTLTIDRLPVTITGNSLERVTVNGGIPAPKLTFTEGDDAIINVVNKMDEPTSIHWHGLLLDGAMDGVTGFNGYKAIEPHKSFTYRFPIRQAGTYWYHSHTGSQEQDGLYGSILINPKEKDTIQSERSYVVVLSDFSQEKGDDIMRNLKMSADYYANSRLTVFDFIKNIQKNGVSKAFKDAKDWGDMRMMRTDLSDVTGYTFLVNGKSPKQNWTGIFKPNERVRLRFINASAMSFFDVRIPNLKMNVVQADGQNVEPVTVDEFRFAPAETYDVIVIPTDDKAYTIVAEPIDRSGFALGTLATTQGMKGEMPKHRKRTTLSMADMNMEMMMKNNPDMEMNHADMISGWAKTGTPTGHKALSYSDLRYEGVQKDQRKPKRTIDVRLGGNMERYIWTINGKKFSEAKPINFKYGERVRLNFVNETMMAHPMHLHGMFIQLENGQPAEKLPNKHTVIVPPGASISALVTADEMGEWAFHCHLLYHMASGMMTKAVVAKFDANDMPVETTESSKGHHHAH